MTMTKSERIGRLMVLIASLALTADGLIQLASPPSMIEAMKHIGYPADAGPTLAILTFACAALLALPGTSLAGAILTTGFLGGAIAVHVPGGGLFSPPQLICFAIGAFVWVGQVLGDRRLKALLGFDNVANRFGSLYAAD